MDVRPAEADPPEIVDRLWRDVRGGELAIEAGANQGQSLARLAGMFERVVAFEPYPPNYEHACRARAALPNAGSGSSVRCQALSDHDGEMDLRLVTDQLTSDAHEAHEWKDFTALPELTVPCVTMDTVAEQEGVPDFVNLDVEGCEMLVLKGAPKVLAVGRTRWLIEFHSAELQNQCLLTLASSGLRAEIVRHPHYAEGSRLWYNHGWLLAHP